MYNMDDIEMKCSTKQLPLEYKLLEWRLILNRELYESKIIDLKAFSVMENSLLGRMLKIKNEYKDKKNDGLTIEKNHGDMSSS